MASNLKITRELDPKRPAVLFIPGGDGHSARGIRRD